MMRSHRTPHSLIRLEYTVHLGGVISADGGTDYVLLAALDWVLLLCSKFQNATTSISDLSWDFTVLMFFLCRYMHVYMGAEYRK